MRQRLSYDSSFSYAYSTANGTSSREFPLGVGTEQHTFRGVTNGKTMLVQFSSHIDENGCTFAATSRERITPPDRSAPVFPQ